jgi:hypothetical protein
MDGWLDGQRVLDTERKDGRMGGWMGRCMNGPIDR